MRVKFICIVILVVVRVVLIYLHAGCPAHRHVWPLVAEVSAGWSLDLIVSAAVCLAGRVVIGVTVFMRGRMILAASVGIVVEHHLLLMAHSVQRGARLVSCLRDLAGGACSMGEVLGPIWRMHLASLDRQLVRLVRACFLVHGGHPRSRVVQLAELHHCVVWVRAPRAVPSGSYHSAGCNVRHR